jgi:hypothetical protein
MKMTFALSSTLKKKFPQPEGTGWGQVKGNSKGKEKSLPF